MENEYISLLKEYDLYDDYIDNKENSNIKEIYDSMINLDRDEVIKYIKENIKNKKIVNYISKVLEFDTILYYPSNKKNDIDKSNKYLLKTYENNIHKLKQEIDLYEEKIKINKSIIRKFENMSYNIKNNCLNNKEDIDIHRKDNVTLILKKYFDLYDPIPIKVGLDMVINNKKWINIYNIIVKVINKELGTSLKENISSDKNSFTYISKLFKTIYNGKLKISRRKNIYYINGEILTQNKYIKKYNYDDSLQPKVIKNLYFIDRMNELIFDPNFYEFD